MLDRFSRRLRKIGLPKRWGRSRPLQTSQNYHYITVCWPYTSLHLKTYAPLACSLASCLRLHSMHKVVTGLEFRRSIPISSPHCSHCPKLPSSILCSASRILGISFRSRSRMLSMKFLSDSRVARSRGSEGFFESVLSFGQSLPQVSNSLSRLCQGITLHCDFIPEPGDSHFLIGNPK